VKRSLIISVMLSAVLMCGCLVGYSSNSQSDDQVLNVGLEAELACLDPHLGFDAAQDLCVRQYIFDRLVTFANPGLSDWDLAPGLAESWDVSSDGKTVTFNLRQGVMFHKGYGEFTSRDVAFSIERVKSDVSSFAGQDQWVNVQSVETPDDYTAIFHLGAADPLWLAKIAYLQGGPFIVSQAAIEALGEEHKMNPIGTGPFEFSEYVPGESVTLSRNEAYWGDEWSIAGIVYKFITDDNARTLGLLSGELDIVKGLSDESWINMVVNGGAEVDYVGPSIVPTISFQLTNEVLANKDVRLAIVHAINRDDVAMAMGSMAEPVYGGLHSSWKYATDDVQQYGYDPELAKQYLAAAGYPDGFEIEVYSSQRAFYLTQYTVIQEQLRQVGITLTVNVVDHPTYWANNFGDLNPIVITGYIQFPSAGVWLRAFGASDSVVGKPTSSFNFSHYGDIGGSIDGLLSEAEGQSEETQEALYKEAQQQVMEDLPFYNYLGSLAVTGRSANIDLGYEGDLSTRGGFWVRLTAETMRVSD
jgi:peptide/nickel transport system substrate-binding protein